MADPGNASYGLITGRFVAPGPDSADPGREPDWVPLTGLDVTFTPTPLWLLDAGASPDPVTILPNPVPCTTDNDGYLINSQGARGVSLLATDDPDINPSGWTWTVRIVSPNAVARQFSFGVPSGSTQDIADLSPVASSRGNAVTRGEPGPPGLSIVPDPTMPGYYIMLGTPLIADADGLYPLGV